MWAVRSRDWRYIECDDGDRELYDLASDPAEEHCVQERHFDVCQESAQRLAAHRADRTHEPTDPASEAKQELDEIVLERLRDLGYIE